MSGQNNGMYGKTGENHLQGMLGKTPSASTKTKMNLALIKKVFVFSFDPILNKTTLYKSFSSVTETTKHFNCSRRHLSRYLDKNKLFKNQWILSSSEK